MTMMTKTLKELVERLEQPFDVDALRRLMNEVGRAAERERDGLLERVPRAARVLAEAAAEAQRRADEVAKVDERTRGGLVGTLLSSADSKAVERKRQDAANALYGDLAVLERSIEDARALAAQVRLMGATLEHGIGVLASLEPRAAAAEVEPSEVATIARARGVLEGIPVRVLGLPATLDAPVSSGLAVAHEASQVLTRLRGTGRADTLGEALFGDLAAQERAEPLSAAEAKAQVESTRDEARRRARRDAEARAAAMAELDALEKDGW